MIKFILTSISVILVLTLATVARSGEDAKFDGLVLIYTGNSDKIIAPIAVSTSEAGVKWLRTDVLRKDQIYPISENVVSQSTLSCLISGAKQKEAAFDRQSGNSRQGLKSVSAMILTANDSRTILFDVETVSELIDGFVSHCSGNGDIKMELEYFQKRIRAM